MKRLFRHYAIIWLIVLVVINIVLFATPLAVENKFTPNFWLGYSLMTVICIFQFIFDMLRSDEPEKVFYDIPLMKAARKAFIEIFIAGLICVFVPFLPTWAGILICALALTLSAIGFLSVRGAISAVKEIGERVKEKSSFIRSLTVDAEILLSKAAPEIKDKVKEVFEAVRYSDPMSREELKIVEAQITLKFSEFSSAVSDGNFEKVQSTAQELLSLLSERNKKCKILK